MSKLDRAKGIIKRFYRDAQYGIFNTRNVLCDPMSTIYNEYGLRVDICYRYEYFEVFGLDYDEFEILRDYYNGLRKE